MPSPTVCNPGAIGVFVAGQRSPDALWSRSAAFGKFINPTLDGGHAAGHALRPPKRLWVSTCYESPIAAGDGPDLEARIITTAERHLAQVLRRRDGKWQAGTVRAPNT